MRPAMDSVDSTVQTTAERSVEPGAIGERDRWSASSALPATGSRAAPSEVASAAGDVEAIGDRRIFLSTVAPSRRDWRLAAIIALLSLITFAAVAPFAKVQLPAVPAFVPAYESALLINDLITAILLFGQFSILRVRALLVLAGGYLFSGLMAIPHALTLPG